MGGDGRTETEIRRRIQVGANARRKVEGVMGDKIYLGNSKKRCLALAPAYLYGFRDHGDDDKTARESPGLILKVLYSTY